MMNKLKALTRKSLFLPIASMLLVMVINIFYDIAQGNVWYNFFSIQMKNGILYGRLIDILNPTPQTMDALTKLDLPAGVEIEIKL